MESIFIPTKTEKVKSDNASSSPAMIHIDDNKNDDNCIVVSFHFILYFKWQLIKNANTALRKEGNSARRWQKLRAKATLLCLRLRRHTRCRGWNTQKQKIQGRCTWPTPVSTAAQLTVLSAIRSRMLQAVEKVITNSSMASFLWIWIFSFRRKTSKAPRIKMQPCK